jgi:lipoprotein-releasing system ATP-binding protein
MSEHHAYDLREEVLRLEGLRKSYNVGKPTEVEVLHGLDLRLQRSDFAALVGASGSGKSTLLNLIGLLDRPTAGELVLLGEPTRDMDDARRTALRGSAIGFVFQFHHLIQAFTVLENVLMPLMVATGKPTSAQREHARALLAQVGLEGMEKRKPDQLSGGQQQRVAVARALAATPSVVLADEPTAALDRANADGLMDQLATLARESGMAALVSTHDQRCLDRVDRVIRLENGALT